MSITKAKEGKGKGDCHFLADSGLIAFGRKRTLISPALARILRCGILC